MLLGLGMGYAGGIHAHSVQIMVGIFLTSGQVCSATSRLLVHENLHDELVTALKAALDRLVVGHPLEPGTQMGPLVSATQLERVREAVTLATAEGVTAYAPDLPEGLEAGGYYYPPTLLIGADSACSAWREEVFGPVLCVRSFGDEAEALRLGNETTYGLANAVFSMDAAQAERVAQGLRSGVVWQNCSQVRDTNAHTLCGPQTDRRHT